jgi:ribosome maturation factor RimP
MMTFKEKVSQQIEKALEDKSSLFLVDLKISEAFKISISLDGDQGVSLQDCIEVSRFIDNNLDREEQDFTLEVASAGVSTPLKSIRQYKKNIGRTLKLKTIDETFEAKLEDVNDDFIILAWTSREPKKIGKGKETVQNKKEIPFTDIKEAIVTIIF